MIGKIDVQGHYFVREGGQPTFRAMDIPPLTTFQVQSAFPDRAERLQLSSVVLVRCEAADAKLSGCTAISYLPGVGFDEAALRLAPGIVVPLEATGQVVLRFDFASSGVYHNPSADVPLPG